MSDAPPGQFFLWIFMAAYFCAGAAYVVSGSYSDGLYLAAGIMVLGTLFMVSLRLMEQRGQVKF